MRNVIAILELVICVILRLTASLTRVITASLQPLHIATPRRDLATPFYLQVNNEAGSRTDAVSARHLGWPATPLSMLAVRALVSASA